MEHYEHYAKIAKIMLQDERLGNLLAALLVQLDLRHPDWDRVTGIAKEIQKISISKGQIQ